MKIPSQLNFGQTALPETPRRKNRSLPDTVRLPSWVWVIWMVLVVWGATTVNPLITVCSLLMLPVIPLLLWRLGEPPVLMFAAAMQWLQAAVGIFYHNSQRDTLEGYFGGPELGRAIWLSLGGVLAVTVGMRVALAGVKQRNASAFESEVREFPLERLVAAFVLLFVLSTAIRAVAGIVPGLTQPLLAATSLHWIPVMFLAQAVLAQRRGYGWLVLIVAFEFAIGSIGFFSGFKEVFFLLAVVLLTAQAGLSQQRWLAICFVGVFILAANCIWTAIKVDYRFFLNEGTGEQVATAPTAARIDKLVELLGELDQEKIENGFEQSMQRLSYVELFAHCMVTVPAELPYEHGALWLGAVQQVFTPRLLFPDKAPIHDSYRAQKYTGINWAGPEEGASIGLGYMAESYIDFGPVFMFAPIFLLGVFYGLIYRLFAYPKTGQLLGMALAVCILVFGACTIETSNIKLVGGNTMALLVMWLFKWQLGKPFMRFIQPGAAPLTVEQWNRLRRKQSHQQASALRPPPSAP